MKTIEKSLYSLLDWLGDWGGLSDALFLIADFLLAPLSIFALKTHLAVKLVGRRDKEGTEAIFNSGQGISESKKLKMLDPPTQVKK